MRCIVVEDSRKSLSYSQGKAIVKSHAGEVLLETTISMLDSILIFGNPRISSQLIKAFAKEGKNIHYFSSSGEYVASIDSVSADNYEKQRIQFRAIENQSFALDLAKRILYSKVSLQKALLRDYDRFEFIGTEELAYFDNYLENIAKCQDMESLLGYEGRAAKTYFYNVNFTLKNNYFMRERNRRPPKDPFNALLSFAYHLLYSYLQGVVRKYGLNAGGGVLHKLRRKHATLVSDLMEEWRIIIADEICIRCARENLISVEEFNRQTDGGVYLQRLSRKKFINEFQMRMLEKHKFFQHTDRAYTAAYAMDMQIESLMRAYTEMDPSLFYVVGESYD